MRMLSMLVLTFTLSVFADSPPDTLRETFGARYQSHLQELRAPGPTKGLDSVHRWNRIAIDATGFDHANAREQLGPGRASRAMAIAHIAMFDTIVAVIGDYESYTGVQAAAGPLSLEAAISQAEHDTLLALFP